MAAANVLAFPRFAATCRRGLSRLGEELAAVAEVRATCAAVVAASSRVSISPAGVAALAASLSAGGLAEPPAWDDGDGSGAASVHYSSPAEDGAPGGGRLTALYVLLLDALNWCFWPARALEYRHLAAGLRDALARAPAAFAPAALAAATEADVAGWLPAGAPGLPNAPARAAAVRELGRALDARWGGDARAPARAAANSAAALVDALVEALPRFRDEAVYAPAAPPAEAAGGGVAGDGGGGGGVGVAAGGGGRAFRVAFYKRAQLAAADLWAAHGRLTCARADAGAPATPVFAFYDVGELTAFADYRLPQLLRAERVLAYAPALAAAVDARAPLAAGSGEEVEIRAATVVAVDALLAELRARGASALTAAELDWRLWQLGEARATTGDCALARDSPHHRVDTIFY